MLKNRPWSFVLIALVLVVSGCTKQARRDRHLQKAERYFQASDYNKAEIEYLNVLRLDHFNPKAIERLGRIYYEQGSPLRAYPFLLKARELAADNLDARLRLGQVYFSSGERTNARNEAIAILTRSPRNEEVILLFVDASVTTNEVNDAKQRLQEVRQGAGDCAGFHLAFANLLLRSQNVAAAETEVRQALTLDAKSRATHLALARLAWSRTNLIEAEQEFKMAADLAPLRSTTRLRYAEFKAQSGAVGDAKKLLHDLADRAPDFLPAWSLLGQIAFAEKNYDQAIEFLERVLRVDAANFDTRVLLAQVRLAQGQPAKAVEVLEKLNRIYSKVPRFKYQLALAHYQNTNLVQAIAAADQAIALNPDFTEAVLFRSEVTLGRGDAAWTAAVLQDFVKRRPDVAQAHLTLARAYQALNRLEEAAAIYRGVMKVYPDNPQPRFLLGLVLRQQENNTEARAVFEKALELAPDDLFILSQLVDLDVVEKKFSAALARIGVLVQKNPKSAGAKFLEGRIYAAQTDWDKAEESLLKALDLDVNLGGAYYLLATTYRSANKLPQAAEQLRALLAKNARDLRAQMLLAMVYNEMKDYEKARVEYEKVLGIDPKFFPALNNMAYLCAEQLGQPDKAYQFARKARDLEPGNASVADTLGWILYKRGDYQQAQTLIRESTAKVPGNPEMQYHLGMTCYRMGQVEAARNALQQAAKSTEIFPGKDEAARRLAWLENDADKTGNSVVELQKRLKEDPNDMVAELRLGDLYQQQGAAEKAAKVYEEALAINPKAASAMLKLAELNAGPLQNRDRAFDWARKARELAPTDAVVAQTLGRLAYQSGDYGWAYSLLQESARQPAAPASALYHLGWAAYSVGQIGEAEQAMQHALQLDPQMPQANEVKWFLTMTALYEKSAKQGSSMPREAETQVEQILKADARFIPGLMILGMIQARRGDPKSAIQTYESVLARFPQFAPAQKQLAAVYADDPINAKKAYDLAMKAREAMPDDPELAKVLGKLGYQKKDYVYAVQLLQESARNQPTDAESFYYLGMAHYQLKEKPQSKEALQRALALNLHAKLGDEARRIVSELK